MNDPISWDPTLVKKYSSSNYYKLLNQLRNEVKKYPLNKKKNISANQNKDINNSNKINSSISYAKNRPLSNNSNHSSEVPGINSTISFNNAKNFSIYNNKNNNNVTLNTQHINIDDSNKIEEESSQTFKDRLNQIDMK